MVRSEAAVSEYFQIRKLLWDELKLNVRPLEEEELRSAVGSPLIEGNEELRQELAVLVEILTEFQQQNDDIRDALAKRPHIPEPPGRPLLIEKLKLLAADMLDHARITTIQSSKEAEVLDYVLSTTDTSNPYNYRAPMHRRLNLDEIDGIKEDLQGALNEERLLLLEDIDFIQGCLEMEKDLIDDDRRKVAVAKPPPSLSDLHELRKTLEKTLEDQVEHFNGRSWRA
ncbi:hypothetical protein AM587_10010836 [Phytophthora nicotianae]|uniref:Uncharacterized protein n=1 Tax=Phytophthora nicotianae TaxID=4792 RepID=A0A0W8CXE2_PHYNI|nr:hypothetical protein AM587_10010836 [Phytophthora nicotianae]